MGRVLIFLSVVWASAASAFLGLPSILQTLLILMGVDIVLGAACAWSSGSLSSNVAWRGITKKVAILAVIVLAEVLEPVLLPGLSLPLSEAVGAYYVFVEALSIVENAGKAGIPIPEFLRAALAEFSKGAASTNGGQGPQG